MHVSADAVGLWRMFEPDFKGQVELIAVELKKGFNLEILKNFRVPSKAVLDAPVPGDARGVLADLGKFEKRVPKKTVEKKTVKKTVRGRGKGSVEGSAAPSSVFEAAGTYQSCSRGYTDYVVVSDTLEGLGVIGSGLAAGGTAVVPPLLERKGGQSRKLLVVVNRRGGDCRPGELLRCRRNLQLLLNPERRGILFSTSLRLLRIPLLRVRVYRRRRSRPRRLRPLLLGQLVIPLWRRRWRRLLTGFLTLWTPRTI
uniref:Uncharacterized protein n=1 Tax=Helianthus annuus TaxID=4232 RepID=A0A251UIG9_HELAN